MTKNKAILLGAMLLLSVSAILGAAYHQWTLEDNTYVDPEYVRRLHDVPKDVEGWELFKEITGEPGEEGDDALQIEASGVADAFERHYKNENGDQVSIYFAVGKGRHVTEHIPRRCYRAVGYEIAGNEAEFKLPLGHEEDADTIDTITSIYHRNQEGQLSRFRIYWNFFIPDEDQWVGTAIPMQYVYKPVVYKVYIKSGALSNQEDPKANPAYEFCKAYMPLLDKAVRGKLRQKEKPPAPADNNKQPDSTVTPESEDKLL